MTAQEIFEECGYLVWFCRHPHSLPIVLEESMDDAILERGTKMVLIEEITKAEARQVLEEVRERPNGELAEILLQGGSRMIGGGAHER